MRPGKAIFIFGLVMLASFFGLVPAESNAFPPPVTFTVCSASNYFSGNGITESCNLQETTGTLIVAFTSQYSGSAGCQAPISSVSDGVNTFTKKSDTGCLAAGTFPNGFSEQLWSAIPSNTATLTVTATWGSNQFFSSVYIFDLSNVPNNYNIADIANGYVLSPTSAQGTVTNNLSHPFALVSGNVYIMISAGPGFVCFGGNKYICNSATSYLSGSNSVPFWQMQNNVTVPNIGSTFMTWTDCCPSAGTGFTNAQAYTAVMLGYSSNAVVTPCNFFQVQCWMYPLLMMSLVGGLMFAAVEPSRPSKEAITYILLASFTFTSAVEVLMGLLPITMPLLLTVIMVVYAWRFR